jgi:hypothetical protein
MAVATHAWHTHGTSAPVAVGAKFLVSLVVGEPEVDPIAYCALCPS